MLSLYVVDPPGTSSSRELPGHWWHMRTGAAATGWPHRPRSILQGDGRASARWPATPPRPMTPRRPAGPARPTSGWLRRSGAVRLPPQGLPGDQRADDARSSCSRRSPQRPVLVAGVARVRLWLSAIARRAGRRASRGRGPGRTLRAHRPGGAQPDPPGPLRRDSSAPDPRHARRAGPAPSVAGARSRPVTAGGRGRRSGVPDRVATPTARWCSRHHDPARPSALRLPTAAGWSSHAGRPGSARLRSPLSEATRGSPRRGGSSVTAWPDDVARL